METFSALLSLWAGNSPVTGEFPSQRPVTRGFDVFFHLCLNKRLSKQSWDCWDAIVLIMTSLSCNTSLVRFGTLKLELDGRQIADGILNCLFTNAKFCDSIRMSLKLFLRVQLTPGTRGCTSPLLPKWEGGDGRYYKESIKLMFGKDQLHSFSFTGPKWNNFRRITLTQ